jgi:hypothetical protein
MDASRWRVVSDTFADAIARPPRERAAWLADVCADDIELRDAVERLITAARIGPRLPRNACG